MKKINIFKNARSTRSSLAHNLQQFSVKNIQYRGFAHELKVLDGLTLSTEIRGTFDFKRERRTSEGIHWNSVR